MTKNSILYILFLMVPGLAASAQESRISLSECLELSHSNNPAVKNAAIDIKEARATRKEAATNWFPTVSASAYGFHAVNPLLKIGLDDVLGSSDAANNLKYYAQTTGGLAGVNTEWSMLQRGYVASVNIAQPIFAGGRIANGNALAALGVKAADIKNDMTLRDNDDEVVKKYWTVVSLSEKKKALQQAIDLVKSLEKDVHSAVTAGLARQSDLLQVQLKAKELESTMVKLRSGEKLAKMDLFNLIGMEYRILDLGRMVLADGFESLQAPGNYYRDEQTVAASLDECKLLEMSIEAKQLEKKMAVGEGLPQIGIGASMGYGQIIGDARANGAVYAMVKIPISEWSRTSRKIQKCQYEIEKARNDKEYLDRQLLLKVNKEWTDLQSAWDEMEAARDAVSLSEMIEAQKKQEFDAGLCTLSELLQCQTELQSARSTLVDCQTAYSCALAVWNK